MFIYAITNDVNDKVYVGLYSGVDLRKRWHRHRWGGHHNKGSLIHKAMHKHGVDKFHITAVWSGHFHAAPEIAIQKLQQLERYYISSFQTKSPNGYNLTDGGGGAAGFKHSEQTISLLKGKIFSEETRSKMVISRSRWKPSDKHRALISASLKGNQRAKGMRHSEETRKKISETLISKGKKQPPKSPKMVKDEHGKWHHSPESKAMISAANRGKKFKPETRELLRRATKRWYATHRGDINK